MKNSSINGIDFKINIFSLIVQFCQRRFDRSIILKYDLRCKIRFCRSDFLWLWVIAEKLQFIANFCFHFQIFRDSDFKEFNSDFFLRCFLSKEIINFSPEIDPSWSKRKFFFLCFWIKNLSLKKQISCSI